MKKRWFTGILAAIVMITVLPAGAAYMPDVTVPGDTDADGSIALSDVVRIQKYLHGAASLDSIQGTQNADMNEDGTLNVFDLALMKKRLLNDPVGYTKRIDTVQGSKGFPKKVACQSYGQRIDNVQELEDYFAPFLVMTSDEYCIDVECFTEEDKERYLAVYDDAFFEENVLYLYADIQSYAGMDYHIREFELSGGVLNIYYEVSKDNSQEYPTVITNLLAQVVIPRTLYCPDQAKWIEVETETEQFTPEITTDRMLAVTQKGWKTSLQGEGATVITSPQELENYALEMFRDPVVRSLQKTYDAAYFAENVLLVDTYGQLNGDTWETSVADVQRMEDGIVLTYERKDINGYVENTVLFTQITIPKAQYHEETFRRQCAWETPVRASYYSTEFHTKLNYDNIFTENGYLNGWVTSPEEMQSFLEYCLTEESMAQVGEVILSGLDEDKAAYLWVSIDSSDAEYMLLNTAAFGNSLTMTLEHDFPVGCIVDAYLHVVYVDQAYAGYSVNQRLWSPYSQDSLLTDGEWVVYNTPDNEDFPFFNINQYAFGDEGVLEFYYTPYAGVSYGSPHYMTDVPVSAGCMPFSSEYTVQTDAEGHTVYEGEHFRLTWGEKTVVVEYETDDGWKSVEINTNIYAN